MMTNIKRKIRETLLQRWGIDAETYREILARKQGRSESGPAGSTSSGTESSSAAESAGEGVGTEKPDPVHGEGGRALRREAGPGDAAANVSKGFYPEEFDFDGLWNNPEIISNHDFMRDPGFVAAHEAGLRAHGSDQKIYWRLYVALYFARRAMDLEGDLVECGVWRGYISRAIMEYVDWENSDKQFYLLDTFHGLEEDLLTENERANTAKIHHLNAHFAGEFDRAVATFDGIRGVHLIRGIVPDTLPCCDAEKVSYLSIDMNCANPEIAAAEYFWDKLVPSAAIVLDDYGFVSYEDQKRAFDKFAEERGVPILALPTGQGIILKP